MSAARAVATRFQERLASAAREDGIDHDVSTQALLAAARGSSAADADSPVHVLWAKIQRYRDSRAGLLGKLTAAVASALTRGKQRRAPTSRCISIAARAGPIRLAARLSLCCRRPSMDCRRSGSTSTCRSDRCRK